MFTEQLFDELPDLGKCNAALMELCADYTEDNPTPLAQCAFESLTQNGVTVNILCNRSITLFSLARSIGCRRRLSAEAKATMAMIKEEIVKVLQFNLTNRELVQCYLNLMTLTENLFEMIRPDLYSRMAAIY